MTLSQEDFLERCQLSGHRNLDTSKAVYIKSTIPVVVGCQEHKTWFEMLPQKVMKGGLSCFECGGTKRITTESFIAKSKSIFGDRWDYSKTEYTSMRDKVTITCKDHGDFSQFCQSHLRGLVGCLGCNGQAPITLKQFIEKSKEKHGDSLDYSKTEEPKNMHSKVTLICKRHGHTFTQEISSNLRGSIGCDKCNPASKYTKDKFLDKVSNLPSNYDYSQVEWNTLSVFEGITIVCPDHGPFSQTVDNHIHGKIGCSGCQPSGTSKLEEELYNFLKSLNVVVRRNDRTILDGKELDFVLEDYKLAIEFNGVYWHSDRYIDDPRRHSDKVKQSKEKGYRLLTIWEDDWNSKKDIIKKKIKHVLGLSEDIKVFARNTVIDKISYNESSTFLESNHIQGPRQGTLYIGLRDSSKNLIAVSVFTKLGNDFVLDRFATSVLLPGGQSKILKYVENNYTYNNLITFADLSISDGGLYEKTGWILGRELDPDYSYLHQGNRVHKFRFRKNKFKSDPSLIYDESMTEKELSRLNGLYRVWDCGKLRYIKPHPRKE